MQASGLVEFASHSYDLHRGVLANPQGNTLPAAITWCFDPTTGRYEDDEQFRARIRDDSMRARAMMALHLGRSQNHPPPIEHWPPISILVPCYNEADNAEETLSVAAAVDYPDFEIVAINDGSRDNTAAVLDMLAVQLPHLRVVHLAKNQGKATALNTGALLARHELLVCIDGDALIDPQALRWIARAFRRGDVGGLAGNPRIRNRTSLLGRLQVGEFSSIIGLIRRAQTLYGHLFTMSGVICAFRKRALEQAGWWSPRTITDDIDVSWRVQVAGWRVIYESNAIYRRKQSLLLPPPTPLGIAEEIRRTGLDEAELITARLERIVIVHIDTGNQYRIEFGSLLLA